MPEDQVVVRLRAEIGDLKGQLKRAQDEIKDFNDNVSDGFSKIASRLAAAFTVGAVIKFVKDATTEFAKFERSFENLGRKIDATGTSFKLVEKEVAAYLKTIQSTTRFSDDEAAAAFEILIQKTNNYTASSALMRKAVDLAAYANLGLAEAAGMLALAYGGNARGLLQVSKAIGVFGEDAKSVQEVFRILDERTKGFAENEKNLATEIDKMHNAWNDWLKTFGEKIAPALTWVLQTTRNILKEGPNEKEMMEIKKEALLSYLKVLKDTGKEFVKFSDVVDITATDFSPKEMQLQALVAMNLNYRDAGEMLKKINEELKKSGKEIKLAKPPVDDLTESWAQLNEAEQYVWETEREGLALAADAAKYWQGVMDSAIKSVQDAMADMFEETFQHMDAIFGPDSVNARRKIWEGFWEDVKNIVLRKFAEIAAASVVQEVLGGLGMGKGKGGGAGGAGGGAKGIIGGTISGAGAGAAMGSFAGPVGSLVGGVVGGVVGAIGGLFGMAEGGIAMRPTVAQIAERGPEAVIPLNKLAGAMAGPSVTFGKVEMVFPGVQRESDLKGRRFGLTAERELAKRLQFLNQRKGVKI